MLSSPRPFKVLGIQQIAIGGPDKLRLQKLWVDMLGLEVTGTFRSERENVDEDICAMGSGPFKVEVDLMQPLDPEKKPAVHATPLNHVGLWIDDLPAAVTWLGAQGVRFAPGRHSPGRGRLRHHISAPQGQRGVPDCWRGRADRTGAGARRSGGRVRPAGWPARLTPHPPNAGAAGLFPRFSDHCSQGCKRKLVTFEGHAACGVAHPLCRRSSP